ncbi:MAG: DUF192 domain-containing protein [Ilumatobacteraceae bacterium]
MNSQLSLPTAWLVSDGRVLASADVASTSRARRRGLIGVRNVDTALVLTPCRWIHTVGVKRNLDIAYLDATNSVIKVLLVPPLRVCLPVWKARLVIEAAAGSFERWGLKLGDVVEVRRT